MSAIIESLPVSEIGERLRIARGTKKVKLPKQPMTAQLAAKTVVRAKSLKLKISRRLRERTRNHHRRKVVVSARC